MDLWELPSQQAAIRPEAAALRFEGRELTYAQLADRASRVAALLSQDWGVHAGDRVAWLGLNHCDQIVLLFALARLGAMLLPLNVRLAAAEWEGQLRDCEPSHLVHDEEHAAQAMALAKASGIAAHARSEFDRAVPQSAPQPGNASSAALLVYTSGTTGKPRAAVHTQSMLLANMRIAAQVQRITPQDRVLTVLPLFHVGGLCIQTLPALYAGASVTLHARFSADATFDTLATERTSLTLQVPATMKGLVDHPRWPTADLSCLRAVWAGSSILPPALARAFLDRGVPLCNVYGATETGPFSIALPPEAAHSHAGSCGWPAAEVEVMLADAKQDAGELLVRGPNVIERYWPDVPARDAEGWFPTGDLATRASDGSYTVVGRAKDLIISGGENIHPLQIETELAAHEAVAECAAFGIPDAQWGETVAVAVVLHPGAALSHEQVREHLAARLARFKLPRSVFFVDALPKTALGKLQRGELQRLCTRDASHTRTSTGRPSTAVAVKKLT